MHVYYRHPWDVTTKQAIELQNHLAPEVIYDRTVEYSDVKYIAGVDVSVKNNISQAAIVVMKFPKLSIVETVTAQRPTDFPYVPGLLSFREGAVLVDGLKKLETEPDVFIFDGMGRIHPRRIGIASHMGLWLNKPTIGCGKSHLLGKYRPPSGEKGAYSYLSDKGETLGVVLRTRMKVKPVYISPGHLINLDSSIRLVMACTGKYRLPEPIRAAHDAAGAFV